MPQEEDLMRSRAKTQAFGAEFPWVGKFLPPGEHDYNSAPVDADILDRETSFNNSSGKKNRILLLDRSGGLLAEVCGLAGWWPTVTIKLGGFSRMKQERVSEALERLGETADDVAFIVFISPQKRQLVYVCVYYTRANTTVAKVWRYLAAQEEAKIRKKIQHALSASEATEVA